MPHATASTHLPYTTLFRSTFVWDPGDGSDTIEGQDGTDTMVFNGADVPERVALSANGNRLTFLRDPGRVTMDTAGVERVEVRTSTRANSAHGNNLNAAFAK